MVEPLEVALALSDDLRFEAPVAILGRVQWDLAVLGHERFGLVPLRVFPAPPGGSACGS